VAAFAMITNGIDILMVALAWAFVLSRVVHAYIHVGPNVLMWRGTAFLVGAIVVLLMWTKLAIHIA
jgi:hypothetical protein